jgi:hypothetical protein
MLTAVAVCVWLGSVAAIARAKNVDLSTVPTRDTVQLTIYNSEDLTLVREVRKVSFKKGVNPLQFSWANTLIDPTSVELRFLTTADRLELLDTTYPHDKPQMLYWNVQSGFDGEATVEITYFTSGVTWSADYVCVADTGEAKMTIDGFVRVSNNSGETYENAQVRLVVGTINLVEKIAQLARVPMSEVDRLQEAVRMDYRRQAAKAVMARDMAAAGAPGYAEEKQIVKEGLSEYFIYTVEGTETIPEGWSKRMRSFNAQSVPLKVQYRYRQEQYGDQLVRMYLLTNDKASGLGTTPLPDGVVRMFRDNGRGGLSFLASQSVQYIPIGDKIELNLGPDPRVVFELVKLRVWRDEIWMKLQGADVYKRVDDRDMKIDVRSTVAGWNDHELYAQRIGNYTGKPIELEIRRRYDGHVIFRSDLDPAPHDYQTVQFTRTVPPARRTDLVYEVVRLQGRNATQNNVTIEPAKLVLP